ncbi:MAG: hypothetical protein D6759_02775 [Chloroflexi bacterium]|nr:MAG: hypothetical protein D6759_02775 [Chloroflexota bacterium]
MGLVLLVLALWAAAGCAQVEVVERSPSSQGANGLLNQSVMLHNLAVHSIAFEPPLDEIGQAALRHGVDLQVRVINTGLSQERTVQVEVQLSLADGQPLGSQEATIEALKPGQSQTVRFRVNGILPQYPHYVLSVRVAPSPGEQFTQDNERVYDLYVETRP